ncbi:MAG: hypothetical protein COA78_18060 [Blastopirellula sp.]|nr:MAG: hypothetical protein COA78_18060 [Blastopirellula sp.]
MDNQDEQIERKLRDVPLPNGLLYRLSQTHLPAEAEVDVLLRNVEVPENLIPRLLSSTDEIPDQASSNATALTDITPLSSRLTRFYRQQPFLATTTAALLFLLLGIFSLAKLNQPDDLVIQLPPDYDFSPLAQDTNLEQKLLVNDPSFIPDISVDDISVDDLSVTQPGFQHLPELEPQDFSFETNHVDPLLVTHLASDLPDNLNSDVFLMRWQPLGASPGSPEIVAAPMILPSKNQHDSEVASTSLFDRNFLFKEGVYPYIRVPNTKKPQHTRLNLSVETDSYDYVRSLLREKRLPAADRVRVEQFVNATSHFFPEARPGQLALRTAAGPAIFASPGTGMIQIGAIAGASPRKPRVPVHLTIALDVSSSLCQGKHWDQIKQSLSQIPLHLADEDTATLVIMGALPYTAIHQATAQDIESWTNSLQQINLNHQWNLAAGIRYASSVALDHSGSNHARNCLLVVSDNLSQLDHPTKLQLEPLLNDASSQGIDFQWLEVADPRWSVSNPGLQFWKDHGKLVSLVQPLKINRYLRQVISNQDAPVADHVSLRVIWNPKSVLRYRLIGHNPLSGGFNSAASTAPFYSSETSSALFEVTLSPSGPNEVATAELTWKDSATGKTKKQTQKIGRLQFATNWHSTPFSLQTAQITAQAAELLRDSHFTKLRSNTLNQLKDAASNVNPLLKQTSAFQEVIQLIHDIERAQDP